MLIVKERGRGYIQCKRVTETLNFAYVGRLAICHKINSAQRFAANTREAKLVTIYGYYDIMILLRVFYVFIVKNVFLE